MMRQLTAVIIQFGGSWCRWSGYLDLLPDEFGDMPVFWDQEDLQPLRNTSMAEKLSGKWPLAGCHVEPPTQVTSPEHHQNITCCCVALCIPLHKTLLAKDCQFC